MGDRNFRRHEPKKSKKAKTQALSQDSTFLPTNPEVEVIGKKGKKHQEE